MPPEGWGSCGVSCLSLLYWASLNVGGWFERGGAMGWLGPATGAGAGVGCGVSGCGGGCPGWMTSGGYF